MKKSTGKIKNGVLFSILWLTSFNLYATKLDNEDRGSNNNSSPLRTIKKRNEEKSKRLTELANKLEGEVSSIETIGVSMVDTQKQSLHFEGRIRNIRTVIGALNQESGDWQERVSTESPHLMNVTEDNLRTRMLSNARAIKSISRFQLFKNELKERNIIPDSDDKLSRALVLHYATELKDILRKSSSIAKEH